jgi:uncharacterized lipoprotein NlpE involved in copper resistance
MPPSGCVPELTSKIEKRMFKKQFVIIAMTGLLLAACGESNSDEAVADTTQPGISDAAFNPVDTVGAEGTASTSIDYAGSYKGIVPCADCEGIETLVELKADKTYKITLKYLGKGDEKPATAAGKWSWKTGNIIQLEGENFGPDQYFVSEGRIIQLDLSGERITGALADRYVLAKQ